MPMLAVTKASPSPGTKGGFSAWAILSATLLAAASASYEIRGRTFSRTASVVRALRSAISGARSIGG